MSEAAVRDYSVLAVKVPHQLRQAIEQEAKECGLSLSSLMRLKLLNRSVATMTLGGNVREAAR